MENRMIVKYGIIGDADSIYIKRYIEDFSIKYNRKVVLFTEANSLFCGFYRKNNIEVVIYDCKNRFIRKNYYIHKIFNTFRLIRLLKEKEIKHIIMHYVHIYVMLLFKILNIKKNIVLFYWGSDINKVNKNLLICVKNLVYNAHSIIVETKDMKEKVCEVYGNGVLEKIKIINFSNNTLSEIDKLSSKIVKSNERIRIAIGYNANESQQHLKILNELKNLSIEEKQKIELVLPMCYPSGELQYRKKVESTLNESGINYIVYDKYMNAKEIANMCNDVDVFVNVQETDSLSNSMIEFIYAGSYTINGSWLHYSFLEDNKIICDTINKFSEFNDCIRKIIKDGTRLQYDLLKTREILSAEFGTNKFYSKWKEVVDDFLTN